MNRTFIVDQNIRLDQFLTNRLSENRNQIDKLIKKGFVSILGKKNVKSGLKIKIGQTIHVTLPKMVPKVPFEVNFDIEIVYQDDYILIINKPSGIVVHPAPSVKEATLVDWLKLNNVSLSTISGEERHGIVHRLDKGTSGLMVVAKTNEAHVGLSRQLENKIMGRIYLALIDLPLKDNITIQKPIGRNPNNRLKQGVIANGKTSKTNFLKLATSKNQKIELIAAKLFTGRTHQIRVHLEFLNRHILGDVLYGYEKNGKISRVMLHAYYLYLIHPKSGEKMFFKAKLFDDMKQIINENFSKDIYEKIEPQSIISEFDNFNNSRLY